MKSTKVIHTVSCHAGGEVGDGKPDDATANNNDVRFRVIHGLVV